MSEADRHASRTNAWLARMAQQSHAYTQAVLAAQDTTSLAARAEALNQPWRDDELSDGAVYVPREWSAT